MSSAPKPDWPAATVQYRLNLAYELHATSPAISALHIARAAAIHPEISSFLQSTHCPKCGTYRYSGDHSSSLVGSSTKKRKRRSATSSSRVKALQTRCRLCGFSIDARTRAPFDAQLALPRDPPRVGTPNTPRAKETGQDPPPSGVFHSTSETLQETQHVPTPPLKLPAQRSHTQSRHTSLKDMLSRDRQREDAVKSQQKKKEGREGLAAFLREL